MPFEAGFQVTDIVSPSQITPNVRNITRAFEIIGFHLGVFPTVGIFFDFYGIKVLSICVWVTPRLLPGRHLSEPRAEPYES